jgi:hypothetical protein
VPPLPCAARTTAQKTADEAEQERAKTAYEHAWEIRDHPFEDAEWGRKFRAFLHGRALS